MFEIRHAEARGVANFGWLNSKHTFSFGHYYDPRFMGFDVLRVINEDRVQPGSGSTPTANGMAQSVGQRLINLRGTSAAEAPLFDMG